MFRISYAITAHNEHLELDRLLSQLDKGIRDVDEVVIQVDGTVTTEVLDVISKYPAFSLHQFPLNGNFASFKNNLKSKCTGEWIVQIDADEYLHPHLLADIPDILASNPTIDLFLIPRINTVEGLTQEHIQKWGWNIGSFPEIIKEKVFDLDNPRDLAEYGMLKEHNLVLEEKQLS